MDGLFFELPFGLTINGETHKEVELLKTNGVAEKIFLKKLSEKPFTWQGNVISAAVKRIGNIEIGAEVRKKYQEDGAVTIPWTVLELPLAEVNTLLVEIHRRVWVSFIPKQEVICKYCAKKMMVDIDLDKIDYFPDQKEDMDNLVDYQYMVVDLVDPLMLPRIPKITDREENSWITETPFNRMTFRVPTLKDAIRNERHYSDSIGFWRRIGMDCLVSVEEVVDGVVKETLPKEFHTYYGLKIFNDCLMGEDLRNIRGKLIEYLPSLPYAYYEMCACDRQEEIPMIMEASSFFSE